MSVDTGHRNEARLKFLEMPRKLWVHTGNVTANKKIFPPEYDDVITTEIRTTARKIYTNAKCANKINVGRDGEEAAEKRLGLQKEAIKLCDDLTDLITAARPLFHLKANKAGYWEHRVECAKTAIQKWHNSDVRRYRR